MRVTADADSDSDSDSEAGHPRPSITGAPAQAKPKSPLSHPPMSQRAPTSLGAPDWAIAPLPFVPLLYDPVNLGP
ncbi:hypothetical protein CALCODRAFT_494722 [Calocera cornea HHB12733]|uniref:Uncharacterized protein n=1 Tax=Calocera cornea HHB12733 TaxID=1353952 RepID=A0A165GXS8_9BASI|nr:hypothetical protein CALCODRAFT_494722 [Calocera cornea HHB12733]